jgi:hypothetical protein
LGLAGATGDVSSEKQAVRARAATAEIGNNFFIIKFLLALSGQTNVVIKIQIFVHPSIK